MTLSQRKAKSEEEEEGKRKQQGEKGWGRGATTVLKSTETVCLAQPRDPRTMWDLAQLWAMDAQTLA